MASGKILIIGGGIGGLACALALIRRGIAVEVYEQATELREVGAGVQLGANGTRVLHALGLRPALEATQVVASGKEARLWNTGQTWTTFDLSAVSQERYGAPHIFMHRGDLQAALADAIRRKAPDAIKLGRRLVDLTQDDTSVTVRFADGSTATGTLAIGADGIRSPVRACLFGADQPEFTGVVAWRGLVPMDALPPQISRTAATSWLGPARHILHYPVRHGELMNIVAFVERDDWQVESWTERGTHAELASDFRGWHEDAHTIFRN
ncbi:MAG: NAD(P)-binding protein, partial [Rhizobiales bacterium]|nr:NAD(P)-binding protein [Hyphomicrobiales bacterium]